MKSLLASVAAIALLAAPAPALLAREDSAPQGGWGVALDTMSPTVRAGDDFYRHVNEGWLATARPPAGVPYIDASVEVFLATEKRVRIW